MHRYHWADVCTALRFACVGLLGVWAVMGGTTEVALATFAFGEIMDALDGSLARRYPYPADGKRRWWRDGCDGRLPEIYDQVADILLGAVALLYVGLNIWPELALVIVIVAAVIAVPVQIWRHYRIKRIPDEDDDPLRQRVILARRVLYLLAIATIVVVMIHALPWSQLVRVGVTALGLVVTAMLCATKADRMQRDKPRKE